MQVAIDVAGFSAADADELRRAMGSKRSDREDGAAARAVLRRDGGQRDRGRAGRQDLRPDAGVRELRLPGEPLDQLRVAGLLQRLVQALPPGGVLRGAAQRPADGLLLAAVAGGRRPPARGAGARPGRQPRRGARPCCSRTRTATAGRRSGWGWPRSARSATKLAERIDAERAANGPYRGPGRPGPPRAAHRPAGRGAGHGRGVRVLRGGPARGAVGGRGGRRGAARTSCRAPPSGSTRRRCRG